MILSDIPQHREIFEDDIPGIQYFGVGNADMLSESISLFLRNCEDYSRVVIGNYIREKFDSRIMSQNYQKFYRQCIKSEVLC